MVAAALEQCKVRTHSRKLFPVRCRTLANFSKGQNQTQKPQPEAELTVTSCSKASSCVFFLSESNFFSFFYLQMCRKNTHWYSCVSVLQFEKMLFPPSCRFPQYTYICQETFMLLLEGKDLSVAEHQDQCALSHLGL